MAEICSAQYYDIERSHNGDGHRCGREKGHEPGPDTHRCSVGDCREEWMSFKWAKDNVWAGLGDDKK